MELHEAKPTDKQANQDAAKFGFKPTGTTSAHRQQYKDAEGNTVYFSKTTSDRRAYQNFKAQMRRAQRSSSPQPTTTATPTPQPKPEKPSTQGEPARTRYRSGQQVTSGTPVSFKGFMDRISGALNKPAASKPSPSKPSPSGSGLAARMSRGYSNTIRELPFSVKKDLADKELRKMGIDPLRKSVRYKPTQQGYGISNIRLADEYDHDLSESVNISGDFNGNLYMNSQPEQQVEEGYVADILWEGNLYRLELKGRMPSKDELAENLQTSYPGALVQQIYPIVESELNIKSAKRYHPAKLDWV